MDPTSEGPQDQQLSDHDPVEPIDGHFSTQPTNKDNDLQSLRGDEVFQPNVFDNAEFDPGQETRLIAFLKDLAEKIENSTDDPVSNRPSISLNDVTTEAIDVSIQTSVNNTNNTAAEASATAPVGYSEMSLPPNLRETLQKDVNIPSLEPRRRTPLHIAIQSGLNKIARQLIDAGANVDAVDENGMQPLHVACDQGNEELIKLLLDKKATTRGQDRDGWCLLHCVSYHEIDAELLARLVEVDREYLNCKEYFEGWTPINRAAWFGRQSVVYALLKAGVDLGIPDKNGWTPMMTAIEEGNFDVFDMMVDHLAQFGSNDVQVREAVIDQRDDEGMTVLMTLCVAEPSLASEASLRNFLEKLRPSPHITDITDNIDQTALDHAMTLAKTFASPHAQNIALEMIKWWPEQNLLRQNMANETAFDDVSGPLLDAMVNRLKGDTVTRDKLLCWLAQKEERHATAIDILSSLKLREVIDALNHKDEWTLVDWAIYHRKPRVMLNCSALDRFGTRIIDELKECHPYSKAKSNADRKDELTPRKVLDEMGDILKFLPQMRTKSPSTRWKASRSTEDMTKCLEHYNAAVVRFRQRELEAFRFRKVDKVVYDDEPINVITLGQIEQSDSGETAAESAKRDHADTESTFTWVHLPATNMDWMKNTVMKIMKTQSEKEKGYQEKLTSFLQASWVQVPDKTSASRFMRPRYVRMLQEGGVALDTNKTQNAVPCCLAGRKETALFSQFSKQPVELDEKHSRAKNHSLTITDVLGATRRASKLLFQIKDVRDELHILKTIADYQEKVQTSMDKAIHSASNAAFDENMAKYVRNDVDELDRLACNIQEALQTTLTLYETEIANRQAKEAVDQGKRVIIFTVVTVWF
ncbi:Ankyrin repeat and protein kinase domain-containing protein 1 [Colletotrichum sp. SAR 10_76]|nr:Ankyrin repeat and protein kinase domain-containing protein 1 [Colletotrichum sp. SAR 10_76]